MVKEKKNPKNGGKVSIEKLSDQSQFNTKPNKNCSVIIMLMFVFDLKIYGLYHSILSSIYISSHLARM